jgi:hypothetical protein
MNIEAAAKLHAGGPGSGRRKEYEKVLEHYRYKRDSGNIFRHPKQNHIVELTEGGGFYHDRGDEVDTKEHAGSASGHSPSQLQNRLKEVHGF